MAILYLSNAVRFDVTINLKPHIGAVRIERFWRGNLSVFHRCHRPVEPLVRSLRPALPDFTMTDRVNLNTTCPGAPGVNALLIQECIILSAASVLR